MWTYRNMMHQQCQKCVLAQMIGCSLSFSLSLSYTILVDKGRPKNLHFSEFDDKPWCDTKHYKVQILVLYLAINHHRSCQLFSAKLIHKFACYIQLQPLKNLQLMPFKSIRFSYGIDIEIRDKPRSFGNFRITWRYVA